MLNGYSASASRYREMEATSASPGQLVVMLFDHLVLHLAKAKLAAAPEHLAARSDALEVCRAVLTELLVTLDQERGGDIARHLASLYAFMLGELVTLGLRPDPARLRRLSAICEELRDAFAAITAGTPDHASGIAAVS
jgi:flagellar protein FliS